MDQKQRQWMSQEIARWRHNRLLPERYCEFLAQLYQLPDSTEAAEPPNRRFAEWLVNLPVAKWLALFIISGLFCTAGFHFTAFDIPMQIGAVASFVLINYGLAVFNLKYAAKKSKVQIAVFTSLGNAVSMLGAFAILMLHQWLYWYSVSLWLLEQGSYGS